MLPKSFGFCSTTLDFGFWMFCTAVDSPSSCTHSLHHIVKLVQQPGKFTWLVHQPSEFSRLLHQFHNMVQRVSAAKNNLDKIKKANLYFLDKKYSDVPSFEFLSALANTSYLPFWNSRRCSNHSSSKLVSYPDVGLIETSARPAHGVSPPRPRLNVFCAIWKCKKKMHLLR